MEPKKILQVIRPAEGGMKSHLLSLVQGLLQKGYRVEVACPAKSTVAPALKKAGVFVHNVEIAGPLSLASDIICIKNLKKIIKQGHYDILHFHGSKAGMVGRIAAYLAGGRNTVQTVHNFVIYPGVPLVKRVVFRMGERFLSSVTTTIITVSKALKDDLVLNYKIPDKKIVSIYNGIETRNFHSLRTKADIKAGFGIPWGKTVVGTVARMAGQKGLEYLIEAISLIENNSEISFIIAGDGPLMGKLRILVEEKGLGRSVIFPGFIENVPELLSCFDIFVIPSITEGLSITTIEAMASGLPVIASDVGGLPELVRHGETGFLIEPGNIVGLSEAMTSLIGDVELRHVMGEAGRNMVLGNLTNEAMLNQICAVYEKMPGE